MMVESGEAVETNADLAVRLQKKLARRVFLIFLFPYLISIVLVGITIYLVNMRVKEIEVATKLANVERVFAKDSNYGWAIEEYTRLAKEYRRAEFLTRLAGLRFGLDRDNDAEVIAILESAKALNAKYWETYGLLSYIHLDKGRESQSASEGERALRLNPYDAQTLNNLAWIYAQAADANLQDLPKALRYAQKAVELTKEKNAEFLDTLAEVHLRRGDRQAAVTRLQQAVAIASPDNIKRFQVRLDEIRNVENQGG
jgi:tetratricopeptide (TPR) repeat protein